MLCIKSLGVLFLGDLDVSLLDGKISFVYTRVLTQVQFTSSRELRSLMDVGRVNPGWGRSHWRQIRVESGLEPSCKSNTEL